jgi:SAM-dependent methyltransferase
MKLPAKRRRWLVVPVVGSVLATVLLVRRTRTEARWYGFVYRTAYRLGLTIWERPVPPSDVVDLVEGSSPGRALDLGCGTGTDSIYLAEHGWDVTAVDMVPRALAIARRRAAAAGVSPRFVEGDVTRLVDLGIGGGHTLILDFGCFHTLPEDRRDPYVESVSAAAAPGATLLLYGFGRPPRLAPMHAGVTADEVRGRFSRAGWDLVSAERIAADAIEVAGRRADQQFEVWRFRLCYRS